LILINIFYFNCVYFESAAEKHILEHAEQTVAMKFQTLCASYVKLGRNPPSNDKGFGNNLTDKLAALEKQVDAIAIEVGERQKLLDAELKGIHELCDKLGEKYPELSRFAGPKGTHELSDVRVKLMKDCRLELANMIPVRTATIKSLATECHEIQVDLVLEEEGFETVPGTDRFLSYDENIMEYGKTGEFLFSVNTEEVKMLQDRLQELIAEKEQRRNELAITGAEIARLWTLLRVPSEERSAFSGSFKMNLSMGTLSKGTSMKKILLMVVNCMMQPFPPKEEKS
jgi:Microtubule associated protein (MAP65/ASE1 family)